jgi:hypothetical protein
METPAGGHARRFLIKDKSGTALRVSASDPRVIADFVGAAPLTSVYTARIHVPVMVQGGALDTFVPFAQDSVLYGALNPPKYLVEILHTGHTAFYDDGCYPAVPMPFCDAAGPDALTADAAHQFILRYAVPFLLHWVADDNRFDAFLAPGAAPPGVIFTADTGGECNQHADTGAVGWETPADSVRLLTVSRSTQLLLSAGCHPQPNCERPWSRRALTPRRMFRLTRAEGSPTPEIFAARNHPRLA